MLIGEIINMGSAGGICTYTSCCVQLRLIISLCQTWAFSIYFHPLQEGLDLWLQPYRILGTGKRTGLIQVRVARRLRLPAAAVRGAGSALQIASPPIQLQQPANDWNETI